MLHLDEVEGKLLMKKTLWKVELLSSISLARQKLSQYYHISDQQRGMPYHWATILDPTVKIQLYQKPHPSPLLHYENNFV